MPDTDPYIQAAKAALGSNAPMPVLMGWVEAKRKAEGQPSYKTIMEDLFRAAGKDPKDFT